jgi:hypothetical protein
MNDYLVLITITQSPWQKNVQFSSMEEMLRFAKQCK